MINSNTSFGKLKAAVVGRELQIPLRLIDMTFKYFYKENLKQGLYNSSITEYTINADILQQRIEQLDNLASLLSKLGVKVYRPKPVQSIKKIKTPYFESDASSASNVRDLTLVYKDKIVETPTFIRNRYFENTNLYDIFAEFYDNGDGGQWIRSPNTLLTEQSMDLEDWTKKRDFSNIGAQYQMAIDAAQFLRIGKDVIVNVSTYNHYLGYKWVKSFYPESNFYTVTCCDNHIDGMLVCLKPGVFLANPLFKSYEDQLPDKLRKWKFIYPEQFELHSTAGMTDIDIQLASSRGMDINVLSIDENTVLVNKNAKSVIKCLEAEHFNVIEVQLDYGELFAGGIHCSTLDLVREDEYISYILEV